MNDDALKGQIRKCLKQYGVTSQQVIEQAVASAFENGALQGKETLPVRMVLEVEALGIKHTVEGELELDGDA